MNNKTLLWLIPSYDNNIKIDNVELESLNDLALKHNYNSKFVFLTNTKYYDDNAEFNISNTSINYTVKVYDKKVYPNTSIMKELKDSNYDNVMITNIKYTTQIDVLDEMLEKSTKEYVDIVHLDKKRLGFYGELTNLTKALYNKIVKMFTNSEDKLYVRNCVIFNKIVLDLMNDFPNSSAIM
ncbi:MAG: hypothetical protein ACI4TX_00670, partial [Christensenellales bacterium]